LKKQKPSWSVFAVCRLIKFNKERRSAKSTSGPEIHGRLVQSVRIGEKDALGKKNLRKGAKNADEEAARLLTVERGIVTAVAAKNAAAKSLTDDTDETAGSVTTLVDMVKRRMSADIVAAPPETADTD
jgi:hypothetical protein